MTKPDWREVARIEHKRAEAERAEACAAVEQLRALVRENRYLRTEVAQLRAGMERATLVLEAYKRGLDSIGYKRDGETIFEEEAQRLRALLATAGDITETEETK